MVAWERDGIAGGGRWWSSSVVRGEPSVDGMLQTMVAAIVWNPLTVWKVNAVVYDTGMVSLDILHGCWALADGVTGFCTKGAAIHVLQHAKERGGVGRELCRLTP